MGEVNEQPDVVPRGGGQLMKVFLGTQRNSVERHMCGEYGHHLKWKKGALHSLGVDVENVPSYLFQTCFVPFDGNNVVF